MTQSLEQTVVAEISRIAALTPTEIKKLAPHTHGEIKKVNAQLAADSDLSARELARGRMLYKDFLTAIATDAGTPEQSLARPDDFSLCLIMATLIENDDMLAMSQAYQAQDWAAFVPALNAVTQHYEAHQRLAKGNHQTVVTAHGALVGTANACVHVKVEFLQFTELEIDQLVGNALEAFFDIVTWWIFYCRRFWLACWLDVFEHILDHGTDIVIAARFGQTLQ